MLELLAWEVGIDLAMLVLAGVGWVAHRAHHKQKRQEMTQKERHHQERMSAGMKELDDE